MSYLLSANTLRSANLRFSFSKGSERPDPSKLGPKTQDLFYTLPSTLKQSGT